MAWTSERVEKLTILWKNGKSASQIAKELGEGVSRNAVIGKIHRLGLSERSGSFKENIDPINKKNKTGKRELSSQPLIRNNNISKADSQTELNVKIVKKRGRRPSQKSLKKSQTNNFQNQINDDENISKINENYSEVSAASELDKEALANMLELEKRAKKLSLMELTEKTCKWPIGDPATDEFWFCGHQAESGKPYCETHVAIAFQPVSSRRERKQK